MSAGPVPARAAAVLLAAGLGARLGGRPKALIRLNGEPLVCRALRILNEAGIDEVTVVLGARAAEVRALLEPGAAQIVVNEHFRAGQVSSVRAGLAAVSRAATAVLVALCDQPLLTAADVDFLLRIHAERRAAATVPRSAHGRGNPVVLAPRVAAAVLAEGPAVGPRQWLDAHPTEVVYAEVTHHRYAFDLDTVSHCEALVRATGWSCELPAPEAAEPHPADRQSLSDPT